MFLGLRECLDTCMTNTVAQYPQGNNNSISHPNELDFFYLVYNVYANQGLVKAYSAFSFAI